MTQRSYYVALPLLALLSAGYALWTQPYIGPESVTSAATRALILIGWLGLFPVALRHRLDHWSKANFLWGFLCGGAWIALALGATDTIANALSVLAMSTTYGFISGLYAAVARSPAWAMLAGFMMFLAQFAFDFAAVALRLSKVSYGM
jgi:hypothetical protein